MLPYLWGYGEAHESEIAAVDLFCGIGILTHGMRSAGIDVGAGIDSDASCAYAYEANNAGATFIAKDVRQIKFKDIEKYCEDADVTVLAGCAPCQKFSAHRRKRRRSEADFDLVREFLRIAEEGDFDLISMENVPGLARNDMFYALLGELRNLGYQVWHEIVSCIDYGVPQTRKRLVLLGAKFGEISLVPPQSGARKVTVGDCIRDLPPLRHGEASLEDPAHACIRLSKKNLQRIRQSKPGGSWKDWDASLVSKCQQKAYYASYGRMRWDAPAPTITTQFCYYSTGKFGHPDQDRAISVREGALLQTFPRDYKLSEGGRISTCDMARHVGNAVPLNLARAIGASIIAHVGRRG